MRERQHGRFKPESSRLNQFLNIRRERRVPTWSLMPKHEALVASRLTRASRIRRHNFAGAPLLRSSSQRMLQSITNFGTGAPAIDAEVLGRSLMPARFCAGLVAALLAFASFTLAPVGAGAADKAFQRDDLADAAIKLEAQIKQDAGNVTRPITGLRRDADAAFERRDFRAGMAILGQIIALAPNDGANWLRLARTIQQIRASDDNERTLLLERAGTAAYIAYQRAAQRGDEAESLNVLGRTFADRREWRPALDALRLSLEIREVADIRAMYERLREDHGFRVLDYTVD